MRGKHDISPRCCWTWIFVFSPNFYACLNEPGCSLISVWCPDDNLNCSYWISAIFGIYVIWVKILNGIEYQHHTSLNICIMTDHVTWVFLVFWYSWSQLLVRAFTLGMLRDLRRTHDKGSGLNWIWIFVYFPNFFTVFNNEPGCSRKSTWCPDDNLNCFDWISMTFGIYVNWVKVLDMIEYQHHV